MRLCIFRYHLVRGQRDRYSNLFCTCGRIAFVVRDARMKSEADKHYFDFSLQGRRHQPFAPLNHHEKVFWLEKNFCAGFVPSPTLKFGGFLGLVRMNRFEGVY